MKPEEKWQRKEKAYGLRGRGKKKTTEKQEQEEEILYAAAF